MNDDLTPYRWQNYAPSGTIAHATEREPCLALIARRVHSHRVNHLL